MSQLWRSILCAQHILLLLKWPVLQQSRWIKQWNPVMCTRFIILIWSENVSIPSINHLRGLRAIDPKGRGRLKQVGLGLMDRTSAAAWIFWWGNNNHNFTTHNVSHYWPKMAEFLVVRMSVPNGNPRQMLLITTLHSMQHGQEMSC